jgi:hypothetical protein
MRGKIVLAGLILGLTGAGAWAQKSATYNDIYCAGTITTEAIPRDTYIITGEESSYKLTFTEGSYVYVNKGSNQGVKVGDRFSVMRAVKDYPDAEWTKWQFSILNKLGTVWEDEGTLQVVVTHPDVSIAQIDHSCYLMQRGDVVLPFAERPFPPVRSGERFDRFAPPSGKSVGMIITGKHFIVESGTNDMIYVNLGANQGVKLGDYLRVFRYQGTEHDYAFQNKRFAFDVDSNFKTLGYGSVPAKYTWENVPREVLGEGVVVRLAPNSSSVLITFSLREFYAGDYIEIE